MANKVTKRKTADPLSNVRIEPPRTADEARADAQRALVDAESEAAAVAEEGPSPVEIAAKAARVRAEKKLVTAPPKIPASTFTKYTVMVDKRVSWRGQQLRFKGGTSTVSDESHGPGAVEKFRAMGVELQEIK